MISNYVVKNIFHHFYNLCLKIWQVLICIAAGMFHIRLHIQLLYPHSKEKDRIISQKEKKALAKKAYDERINEAPKVSSALFFNHNTQLGPPYKVLIDTNFLNYAYKMDVDIYEVSETVHVFD